MVCMGDVQPLGSDEEPIKVKKDRGTAGLRMQQDKLRGALDTRLGLIKSYQKKRTKTEQDIVNIIIV